MIWSILRSIWVEKLNYGVQGSNNVAGDSLEHSGETARVAGPSSIGSANLWWLQPIDLVFSLLRHFFGI